MRHFAIFSILFARVVSIIKYNNIMSNNKNIIIKRACAQETTKRLRIFSKYNISIQVDYLLKLFSYSCRVLGANLKRGTFVRE